MSNQTQNSTMQGCCGNPIEECFCGNNSFVRTEEVCGIMEPKLRALEDKLSSCIIKCVEKTSDCSKFPSGLDYELAAMDSAKPALGQKLYLKEDKSIHDTFYTATPGLDQAPNIISSGDIGVTFQTLSGLLGGPKCYKNDSCKEMCGTIQFMGVPDYLPETLLGDTPVDAFHGLFSILEVSIDGGAWFAVDVRAIEEQGYFQNHVNHMLGHFNLSIDAGDEICIDMRLVINAIDGTENIAMLTDNIGLTINADTLCQ